MVWWALVSCSVEPVAEAESERAEPVRVGAVAEPVSEPPVLDGLDRWLAVEGPVASGFVAPRRRAGTVAPAAGRVVDGAPGQLVIEHVFYEDHHRRRVRSVFALTDGPAVGTEVAAGDPLGSGDGQWNVHDAAGPDEDPYDWDVAPDPDAFVREHARLFVPQDEPVVALISHDRYELRIYEQGEPTGSYDLSFGQSVGEKQKRGDNRSPKGMYFVVEKSTGPFPGAVGPYYGGFWTKINYPNRYDADRGVAEGWITRAQRDTIQRDWENRAMTFQKSRLGSGIGLHGWAYEWSNDGPRHLSWGCVVTHLADAATIYEALPMGTMVVLL
ncbi:MAG: L,D-transpeptidase [Myxococcota bacterium]